MALSVYVQFAYIHGIYIFSCRPLEKPVKNLGPQDSHIYSQEAPTLSRHLPEGREAEMRADYSLGEPPKGWHLKKQNIDIPPAKQRNWAPQPISTSTSPCYLQGFHRKYSQNTSPMFGDSPLALTYSQIHIKLKWAKNSTF